MRLSQNFSFWETSFACPATLKFAVLPGCCKAKSLKNYKSLQAQTYPKTVRVSEQSISFETGSLFPKLTGFLEKFIFFRIFEIFLDKPKFLCYYSIV
jgi:hypothetical protein